MHLIVCVDDRMGMGFAGRRQSMDRVLREDLLALTRGAALWMAPYSAGQFEASPENLQMSMLSPFIPAWRIRQAHSLAAVR